MSEWQSADEMFAIRTGGFPSARQSIILHVYPPLDRSRSRPVASFPRTTNGTNAWLCFASMAQHQLAFDDLNEDREGVTQAAVQRSRGIPGAPAGRDPGACTVVSRGWRHGRHLPRRAVERIEQSGHHESWNDGGSFTRTSWTPKTSSGSFTRIGSENHVSEKDALLFIEAEPSLSRDSPVRANCGRIVQHAVFKRKAIQPLPRATRRVHRGASG